MGDLRGIYDIVALLSVVAFRIFSWVLPIALLAVQLVATLLYCFVSAIYTIVAQLCDNAQRSAKANNRKPEYLPEFAWLARKCKRHIKCWARVTWIKLRRPKAVAAYITTATVACIASVVALAAYIF